MCSTFKWVLAAAILAKVDSRQLSLDETVPYGPSELLEYAPATRDHVGEGAMTIDALARAAVTVSDNTAANLLLAKIGGPSAFTQFCRSQGDLVTRLDRNEPTLNTNIPGDLRDTTSPRAMVGDLQALVLGKVLSPTSRTQLTLWMERSLTGLDRLRVNLPPGWRAADKTGANGTDTSNDIAVFWPPQRAPVIVAAYITQCPGPEEKRAALLAQIGRLVAQAFTSVPMV